MTRYLYKETSSGAYFVGLPANDLDDKDLDETQKSLLAVAVAAGMYVAESTPKKQKVSDEKPSTKPEEGNKSNG